MSLSRRTVLKGGTALSLALATGAAYPDELKVKTLFLLLDGIGPQMQADFLEQILESFFARGLPLGLVLDFFSGDDPEDTGGDDELLRRLGRIARRERGLIELVPVFQSIEDNQRYFQLRNASELRRRMASSALGDIMGDGIGSVVSVIDRSVENTIEPYAFRSGGFRIQIRPNAVQDDGGEAVTRVRVIDWGLLEIENGTRADILDAPGPALNRLYSLEGDQLLTLSLSGAETVSPERALAACDAWAEALLASLWEGRAFFTRTSDYLIQGNPGASKFMALLLDQRDGPDDGLTAFAEELEEAGFPYSVLQPVAALDDDPGGQDVCYDITAEAQAEGDLGPVCVLRPAQGTLDDTDLSEIILLPPGTPNAWTGLRGDCRFQIALPDRSDGTIAKRHRSAPFADQVELIPPSEVATDIQRRAVIRSLEVIRRDRRADFFSVRGFMNQIVAPEPALRRIWSLRRRRLTDPPRIGAPDGAETARLMEDARLAWSFIEKYTDATTGICAGTVSRYHAERNVTFWDVGSQIFAIEAAGRLGLITVEDAKDRIGRILDHLPSTTIDGLPLPAAAFNSRNLSASRYGYDACDTGRFLIALDMMVKYGMVEKTAAQAVLEKWDLPATIRDGHVFNFYERRWVDDTMTHCTPYTRRGFAAWGMEIEASLPELDDQGTGDDLMRFLHRTAYLGLFGAEPSLLVPVEGGESNGAKFLSEILFDAQLSWYETHGELKAVSEAPIDFLPWFIYQGLRVDRWGEGEWVINTIEGDAQYKTAEFFEKASLISSKSAYLWAACYPHPYSNTLVRLVREKARIEDLGFSVGIFTGTREPMSFYSDLNTNGIILTAIAHMLKPHSNT